METIGVFKPSETPYIFYTAKAFLAEWIIYKLCCRGLGVEWNRDCHCTIETIQSSGDDYDGTTEA